MSLKAFHIVFIAVSILLCFGFGAWLLLVQSDRSITVSIIGGIVSFAAGGALIFYARRFLQKFKKINYL